MRGCAFCRLNGIMSSRKTFSRPSKSVPLAGSAAKQTLAFAIYDMRFSDPLRAQLAAALRDRAEAGLEIRFCYDADKPPQPDLAAGQDPAPAGTGAFVQSLGYPWRRIAGMKLMHSKFVVRDGQAVWTGSTNMTDDAFTLMENNIV